MAPVIRTTGADWPFWVETAAAAFAPPIPLVTPGFDPAALEALLEAAAEDPVSGEVSLRLADLFRLRLNISRVGASASVTG